MNSEGNLDSPLAIVVDWPSKEDLKAGRLMTDGGSRVFWQFLLREVGMTRQECYVTSLWKEIPTEEQLKGGLTEEQMAYAGIMLDDEMGGQQPAILALGRHTVEHFLGPVKSDTVHGIVHDLPDGRVVLPSYSPSAGLRDSKRLAFAVDDLKALRDAFDGKGRRRPEPEPAEYRDCTLEDLAAPCRALAIDTEYDGLGPLMLTFSVRPGQGLLILKDSPLIPEFVKMLERERPFIWFHNVLADLTPLKRMGIDIVKLGLEFGDTMANQWYAETEPQGLKPAAWRDLGADSTDFEAVVQPYFDSQLINYLAGAQALTAPKTFERWGKPTLKQALAWQKAVAEGVGPFPPPPRGKRLKDGVEPSTPLHRRLNLFLNAYAAGRVPDVQKRWAGWKEDGGADAVEEILGAPPRFSLREVPMEAARPYACADPDYTLQLAMKRRPYNVELARKDMARIPMLNAMQERGIRVDLGEWEALRDDLRADQEAQLDVLRTVTERADFNPNSAHHLMELLYGYVQTAPGLWDFMKDKEYPLPPGFTKKKQPKTDKKALGTLQAEDPTLPSLLLAYKELEKLRNTYVEPLPRYLDRESVLHPSWRHTRVPSGRLAAVRPNIMAIPARSVNGMRVRGLFKARPGFKLISFDQSQIELRMAAHISQDPVMMQAFIDGVDLHTRTAARIGGKDEGDAKYWKSAQGKMYRALFKAINFGILFGATAQRIHMELLSQGIRSFTLQDCERFVKDWFRLFEGVARELATTAEFIALHGYAEDHWGRRRKLPGAAVEGRGWPLGMLREEAVRQGFNHRIQGGAQGELTESMLLFDSAVLPVLQSLDLEAFPLLQIHDELIFEVPDVPEALETMKELGMAAMTAGQWRYSVPIEAGCAAGAAWSDLK